MTTDTTQPGNPCPRCGAPSYVPMTNSQFIDHYVCEVCLEVEIMKSKQARQKGAARTSPPASKASRWRWLWPW
jgi:predicted RNA-binding Zn-ribbon protein involved in translation (DUF1610 family)